MGLLNKILSKTGLGVLAIGAALALSPMKVDAATISMTDGGSTLNIGPGPTLNFASSAADTGAGDAGHWEYTFGLTVEGTGFGTASISVNNFKSFVNPVISWLDSSSNVLGSQSVDPVLLGNTMVGFAELATDFTSPNLLTQTFRLSWDDGTAANAGFDVSVDINPVPLPAGGLLLLTALGGVVALRRKRKAA